MPPLTTYSGPGDLLVGDLGMSESVDVQRFVNEAKDEMDSRLGMIYELPFDTNDLEPHEQLILKRISNHIATGRLVLAQAVGQEQGSLHAYGLAMLREGRAELNMILDGTIVFEGAVRLAVPAPAGPSLRNEDVQAGVATFYDYATERPPYRLIPPAWAPGGGR